MSSPHTYPTHRPDTLKHAIQHDIKDIDDLDEFLTEDQEECVQAMLTNAGCFY